MQEGRVQKNRSRRPIKRLITKCSECRANFVLFFRNIIVSMYLFKFLIEK